MNSYLILAPLLVKVQQKRCISKIKINTPTSQKQEKLGQNAYANN